MAVRHALIVFVTLRIVVSLLAGLALGLGRAPTTPDEVLRPYQGVAPIQGGLAGLTLGVWQRFDTLWYLKIATGGYSPQDGSTVFPPLYPALIHLLGSVLGGRFLIAALIISNAAYLGALILFFKLIAREPGFDEQVAARSTWYLALFPTAFFFLAAYTESLFLLFTVAAFYFARQGRWWPAGLAACLASLTRLQGGLLFVPLAYEYVEQARSRSGSIWHSLAVFLPPLGALAFLIFRHVRGYPPISEVFREYWALETVMPWTSLARSCRVIFAGRGHPADFLDLFLGCLFIFLTVMAFRKLPYVYGIYMAVTLFFLLMRSGLVHPLQSLARYVVVLFPAFMLLGVAGKNSIVNRLVVYPSMSLLLYLTGQFAMWGWVG